MILFWQDIVDREREEYNNLIFHLRSEEFIKKITDTVKARKNVKTEIEEG